MNKQHCNIDFSNKSLLFSQERVSVPLLSSESPQDSVVYLAKTVQLPGHFEKD